MLTKKQIHQFVRDGYCTFNLTFSDHDVERARALVWEFCPPYFEKNDPSTWSGMVDDSCIRRNMTDRVGRLKFRECTRSFRSVRNLTLYNASLRSRVESLIMPDHSNQSAPRFMQVFRGLYPIFSQPAAPGQVKAHCDTHFFQVSSVIYLSDTDVNDGAFVVWPGSHRMIAPVATELGHHHFPDEFLKCCERVERTITPVSVPGRTGTVVLWHSRLLHAAGANIGGGVRHAALIDFKNGWADAVPTKKRSRAFDENWSPDVLECAMEISA